MSYTVNMGLDYAAIGVLCDIISQTEINTESIDIDGYDEFIKQDKIYKSKLNILKGLITVDTKYYGKLLGLEIEIFMTMGGLESFQTMIRETLDEAAETETSESYLRVADNTKMIYDFITKLIIFDKQQSLRYKTMNDMMIGMVTLEITLTDADVIAEYREMMR